MIKLEVLDKNPLSLQPLIAKKFGIFNSNNVEVDVAYVSSFPGFDMSKVTANVGDTTRIFERVASKEELIITSDLTRTMKLILHKDYKKRGKLKILSSKDQSLGIYTEYYCRKNNIDFEFVIELNMQKRVEMIRNNEVDGVCMIDPFLIEFIDQDYFVAYEGKDHKYNYTCWAFHKQFYDLNKEQVINFHLSLNQATDLWNDLSCDEKLKLALELLEVPQYLYNYYKTLNFNHDSRYQKEALESCYDWKCRKTPSVCGLDISDLIAIW